MEIYRFARVPFGVVSSPFLLAATVAHHLHLQNSDIAKDIVKNIYVDNVLLGAGSLEDAYLIYTEAKRMFRIASMNLREWASNSTEFLEKLPRIDRAEGGIIKVLGMQWEMSTDTLSIPLQALEGFDKILTKGDVLKRVASVFDPLGIVSPLLLKVKLFLQNLWKDKKDWDEPLSTDQVAECSALFSTFQRVVNVRIPRYIGWGSDSLCDLHVFTDASSIAYCAVVYMSVIKENKNRVSLIFSKTRMAPIRAVSIPRLGLLAVTIGCRAVKFVESQLHLPIRKRVLWTDSQCVLYWLRTMKILTTFVENRIKEIKSDENIQFRYINSIENPADLGTRGCTSAELADSFWWGGPLWLMHSEEVWPNQKDLVTTEMIKKQESEIKRSSFLYQTSYFVEETLDSPPFGLKLEIFRCYLGFYV